MAVTKERRHDVSTAKKEYHQMVKKAKLPRTLMGGTEAMREAGLTYLPKEEAESDKAWENRRDRSFLFNGFGRAVRNLTGKIFSKPISLGDDTPEHFVEWLADADLQGRDLNRFAQGITTEAMTVGLCHILVDMPPALKNQDGSIKELTAEEEKTLGRRPYLVEIRMEDLFFWRIRNGKLTEIRILETIIEEDGFDDIEIQQIRVIKIGSWETYRKNSDNEWVLKDSGTTSMTSIPLITVYSKRVAQMVAEPLLTDLAEVNVAHWQSSSDQKHILHVARVPILTAIGLDSDDKLTIGPNSLAKLPLHGDLKYVEHTGAAIKAGAEDIEALEDKMAVLSMEPMINRTGANQTATGKAIDKAEADCTLKDISQGVKDSLEQVLVIMGGFVKIDPKKCGTVNLFSDFELNLGDEVGLQELGKARALGDISRSNYIEEFRRRGIVRETFDVEENNKQLAEEGMDTPPPKGSDKFIMDGKKVDPDNMMTGA